MFKKIFIAAAIGAATLGAQAASVNLVSNGSFDGTTGDYIYNAAPASVTTNYGGVPTQSGTVADWTGSFVSIASNSGAWGNPSGLSGFDSSFGGYVAGVQADGTLSQAGLTLAAGEYTLTWSDATRGATQTYSVYLGTTDLGQFKTQSGWGTESITFTTTGGSGLTFQGDTQFARPSDATALIDNVSVTAVPEPTSVLMMVVGTLGLLAWRRRAQA